MKFKYSDDQINTETDRKILDALNEVDWNSTTTITGHVVPAVKPQNWEPKDLLKDWRRAELMDDIKHLVFHDLLTDEQKIISLKMLLEEDDERD